MNVKTLFALLVTCQAAHSLEEATFGLYQWLPWIRWADNIADGGAMVFFVILNVAFVLFGIWCYFARVKPRAPSAGLFIGLWATIEILNGIGHPVWSLLTGTYVPGTATAPVLLVVALLLVRAVSAPASKGSKEKPAADETPAAGNRGREG